MQSAWRQDLLLDNWTEYAEDAHAAPSPSGEWSLNPLRWALLNAALKAPHNRRVSARASAVRSQIADAGLKGPLSLAPHHLADRFDCGSELIDALLRKSVAAAVAGEEPRLTTRVFTSGRHIAAFYSTRPIAAVCEAQPDQRIPLLFVARLGIDRRWSDARITDEFFVEMLKDAWSVPPERRPTALVGLAASPTARRALRLIGVRMLGDALDPRAVIFPAIDIKKSIEARDRGLTRVTTEAAEG